MTQRRSQFAVFCLAIALVASLIPCVSAVVCAVYVPLSIVNPDQPVQRFERTGDVCDAQPLTLAALVLFRGPPTHGSLV